MGVSDPVTVTVEYPNKPLRATGGFGFGGEYRGINPDPTHIEKAPEETPE